MQQNCQRPADRFLESVRRARRRRRRGRTTAVHLLESGVEINVIRGWLGHVNLDTTNRYAEITVRMKEEALKLCEPPTVASEGRRRPVWRDDASLLKWLASL